jgi:hypothetical protein
MRRSHRTTHVEAPRNASAAALGSPSAGVAAAAVGGATSTAIQPYHAPHPFSITLPLPGAAGVPASAAGPYLLPKHEPVAGAATGVVGALELNGAAGPSMLMTPTVRGDPGSWEVRCKPSSTDTRPALSFALRTLPCVHM